MTSIEWLIDKIGIINTNDPYYEEIVQQAKEMHKKEIIGARMNGMTDDELSYQNAEQYYNNTFKKDKQ